MSEKFANFLMEARNPESNTFKSVIAIISSVSLIFIIYKIYKLIQFEKANPRLFLKAKVRLNFIKLMVKK